MSLISYDLGGLLALATLVLVALFAVYLLLEGSLERATEKTVQRAAGVGTGAGGAAVVGATLGVELLLQFPELVLTFWGVVAITQGVDWDVFLALCVVFYLIAQTVETRYRKASQ